MRSLAKGPKPAVLVENEEQWTADLLAVIARGEKPTKAMRDRYRHHQVKDAVVAETHGKCAYCESQLKHISHGDIEHIIPKSKVPAKSYLWENLTLACSICNGNKGNEYSDDPNLSDEQIIDPYVDNPLDHFLFFREVISPRPDSMRAIATESILKLSRSELLEKRRERLKFIDGLVIAYSCAKPEFKHVILNDLINNHLQVSNEYCASSEQYIRILREKGIIP